LPGPKIILFFRTGFIVFNGGMHIEEKVFGANFFYQPIFLEDVPYRAAYRPARYKKISRVFKKDMTSSNSCMPLESISVMLLASRIKTFNSLPSRATTSSIPSLKVSGVSKVELGIKAINEDLVMLLPPPQSDRRFGK
jgi:hypothetical protein